MTPVCLLLAFLLVGLSEGRIDPCRLPISPGRCLGLFHKWGVNQETGQCESFFYGGCGGNANQFDSREECEIACSHVVGA